MMKRLLVASTLAFLPLTALAQENLTLESGKRLETHLAQTLQLSDGQSASNVWFGIPTSQLQSLTDQQLSGCVLTADIALNQGQFQITTHNMRCTTQGGDIFTGRNISASLKNLPCAADQCNQVRMTADHSYIFELQQAAQLSAEFNASREANRMRINGDI